MPKRYLFVLPFLIASFTGCTTTYTLTSKPSGADIFMNTVPRGTTPTMLRYKNSFGRNVDVTIMKDGYQTLNIVLPASGGVRNFNLKKINLDADKEDPISFKRTSTSSWNSIKIRENNDYSASWNSILNIFSRNFDVSMMDKESGYIRTNWDYKSTGTVRTDYRVRATAKFSLDRTKVEVKTEANFRYNEEWIQGSDIDVLETLNSDIKAVIGN